VPDEKSFKYKNPVKIDNDVKLRAIAYKEGMPLEKYAEYGITHHKGLGDRIIYQTAFSDRYPAGGIHALNDGLRGSLDHNDGYWQGFNGKNMDVIIDFGEEFTFTSIITTYLLDQKKWIFIPEVVNYFISEDAQNFQKIGGVTHNIPLDGPRVLTNDFSMKLNKPMKVRFIRVEAVNIGVCPDWHPGKGQKAWIFIDEIVVK
jgi:hypothetical protein